jgi:hypothetical protein
VDDGGHIVGSKQPLCSKGCLDLPNTKDGDQEMIVVKRFAFAEAIETASFIQSQERLCFFFGRKNYSGH